jgi:hypothetical protein
LAMISSSAAAAIACRAMVAPDVQPPNRCAQEMVVLKGGVAARGCERCLVSGRAAQTGPAGRAVYVLQACRRRNRAAAAETRRRSRERR